MYGGPHKDLLRCRMTVMNRNGVRPLWLHLCGVNVVFLVKCVVAAVALVAVHSVVGGCVSVSWVGPAGVVGFGRRNILLCR
jgi:hypothetical protein